MSTAIRTHMDCPFCGHKECYTEYTDHFFCFSCRRYLRKHRVEEKIYYREISTGDNIENVDYNSVGVVKTSDKIEEGKELIMKTSTITTNNFSSVSSTQTNVYEDYLERRGITAETHKFFGVITVVRNNKPYCVKYKYHNNSEQIRLLDAKSFFVTGMYNEAYGWPMNKFPPGSAQAITITEGCDDAMAVWQMLGGYPVFAVKSATSAEKECRACFDYLNSFSKIYIATDSDGPGEKAAKDIAKLFDPNKVYRVKMNPYKDPCEFLQGKESEFKKLWWAAKKFQPEGILSGYDEIDKTLDEDVSLPVASFPFTTLNNLCGGIKPATTYLVTGLEGIGKTEFFHAVEYHLISTTQDNIGIIHIEERYIDNLKKLVGYYKKLDPDNLSTEETKMLYKELFGKEDRVYFYKHFGSDDPEKIIEIVRFLAAVAKCRYIFLDNITMVVTGRPGDDERRDLDYISTKLEMLVKDLNFTLFLISHENDNEKTRGSRNISKVADVWINIKRDIKNEDPVLRNTQYLTINKGRNCRGTGPAGKLYYDKSIGTLHELSEKPIDNENFSQDF